ncbi:MAG: UpxY family transcription antiterminator [Bacteroidetes bacterium]|nr:UpxY family transcription antiterminator [Bacteroidota bacterium]
MGKYKVLDHQVRWYAIYTRSRAEKKLHTLLLQKNVQCFLPLRKMLSQRSDRKKWIEVPLLPSYLFVRVSGKEHFPVLNTPGAVCFVSFDGHPVAIPDDQIISLQKFLTSNENDVEVHQGSFEEGDQVEVTAGPMKGVKGEVVEIRGRQRLLLRFNTLGYCVHVEVLMSELNTLPTMAAC